MIKTWAFGKNTIPTNQTTATLQAGSFIYQLKAFLVAGGWSVPWSCDGVSVATSDLITGPDKLVWSAAGARSWIVIKSPAGLVAGLDGTYTGDQSRLWLTIHCNNANPYIAEIYLHNIAPTGTADTTHCPTSTNKIGYATQQFLRSTLGNAVFHFSRTSQGAFDASIGYVGTARVPYTMGVFPMTDLQKNLVGKDYPFGALFAAAFADDDYGGPFQKSYTAGLFSNTNKWLGWFMDQTPLAGNALVYSVPMNNNGTWTVIGAGTAATKDPWSGGYPMSDIVFQSTTVGKICTIGKLADYRVTGGPIVTGDVDNVVAPSYVAFGQMLMTTNVLITL